MLLVYYGKGKGKTTAALGTVLRALGRGWRVLLVQFMKSGASGETYFLKSLPHTYRKRIYVINVGVKEFINPEDLSNYTASITMALIYGFFREVYPSLMRELSPKLVVFDELGIASHIGLIEEGLVLNILRKFVGNPEKHAIITGRYVPKTVRDIADLVTEVREVKHYYKKGFINIEGLDV
ncbi:MAG: cob(I)yrinic acid a,c-diamide adenosyltransferase [Desulfurococcaceae archaeon TW002]